MCQHKKLILNRVAPWKRGNFDKYQITVPCNNCPECTKSHQNDWLVRSYFEITKNDYPSKFFVTLDYSDTYLPRYNGIPCFDQEHMKSFFKRLRYYVGDFRYLYSTDYGAALQRPHYHIMFLFNRLVTHSDFFSAVNRSWYYGFHQRIDLIKSGSSVWDCVRYVCKYTVKDITFSFHGREKAFPSRYRSRTQASSFFGYSALEEGDITFDMLKKQQPVYLPIGKDGLALPFSIPRYYEIKITQYSVYYPEFRRSEFFKNELGFELQEIRHNCHYIYLFEQLLASIFDKIHTLDCYKVWSKLYPDSPYIGCSWTQMFGDVLGDGEDFLDFLYISPFLKRTKDYKLCNAYGGYIDTRYYDDWLDHLIYNDRYELYNQVLHLYRLYCSELDYSHYLVDTYASIQEAHKRVLHKIQINERYRRYLDKVGFDYSKLFDLDVVTFKDNFDRYVSLSDIPYIPFKKDMHSSAVYNEFRVKRYCLT